jgi:ubiquinol-cytochrome c reductase cytochrome c1 subunit
MVRRIVTAAAALFALSAASVGLGAEEAALPLLDGKFSFDTTFGTIDMAAAQRGLQIYTEICSNCHMLKELSYRNIAELGYTEDQVKAYAANYKVPDLKDDGTVIQRTAKPSDKFVHPFPNDLAARAANNGALPPDLALIVKSRKGGANYVYSLMQGYEDPPADVKMNDGAYYNKYFVAGAHQIGMPQPLQDDAVKYADGSKADLASEAHDVATFLEWAANPELNQRKQMGIQVLIYLFILTVVLYIAKRIIWRNAH